MTAKYIFLDIDGTLVDFNGKMPDSACTALKKAHQNGHKLIICTGRQRSQVYPWLLEKIPFDGMVVSAGAMVVCGEKTIFHKCIENQKLRSLLRFFDENAIAYYLQTASALVSKDWCVKNTMALFQKQGYAPADLVSLFGDTVIDERLSERTDIEKLVYYDSGHSMEAVQESIGNDYHIVGYSFANLGNTSGEVSQADVHKATGIHEYLKYCGADIQDTIAIGDGSNDIEMLEAAGISVAMGNAVEDLKLLADLVTADINQDGLCKAFEALHLI